MTEQIINNKEALEAYIVHLRASFANSGDLRVSCVKPRLNRTQAQNRAIHLYCTQLAEAFNDAGLDMVAVLKQGASIPWNPDKVKEDIWKAVQFPITNKTSTAKLETDEVSKVYDVVSRHISQTVGVYVPFPSVESLMREGY